MRWAYRLMTSAMLVGLVSGCGGNAGDRLTLQFLNFEQPANSQLDTFDATSAQLDNVQDLCPDNTAEPFTDASFAAVFINQGAADINLDTVTINIPNSGVPQKKYLKSFIIPGGRCSSPTNAICGTDSDCTAGGTCSHSETTLTSLFLDAETKLLVSPGTYDVTVTFSGEDSTNDRFTVPTHITVTFQDYDHC